MEENSKSIESLLERATDYGKTSYELIKLKTIDKTSDVVSSGVPHTIALILITIFMVFLNLGLGLMLGDFLGKTYYGFFVVAGFYIFLWIILRVFMYKWLKEKVRNNIIKQILN
jgi:hypothetical protein